MSMLTDLHPFTVTVPTGGAMAVRSLTTEEVAERFRSRPPPARSRRPLGVGPAVIRVGRRVLYDEAECDRRWQSKVATAARDGSPISGGVVTRSGGR